VVRASPAGDRRIAAAEQAVRILRRLVLGEADLLELRQRCAGRTRERALLVDPERLYLHSLARMAQAAPQLGDSAWPAEWIVGRIDASLQDILMEDEREEGLGLVPADPWKAPHTFLMHWFGIEGRLARAAAVKFNGLPERRRRSFFDLVVEGKSIEDCVARGFGPPSELRDDVRAAFSALFLLRECQAEDSREGDQR